MVKIQLDLTEEENRLVDIYKLVHNLKNKQEAIKKMVSYFKVKIVPEKNMEEDYFKT